MGTDFFRYWYNIVVQLARRSLKQFFYYGNISFGYFLLTNCESLTCAINKIVQNSWIVIQNVKTIWNGWDVMQNNKVVQYI